MASLEVLELERMDAAAAKDLRGLRQSAARRATMLRKERELSRLSPQSSWQLVMEQWKYRKVLRCDGSAGIQSKRHFTRSENRDLQNRSLLSW